MHAHCALAGGTVVLVWRAVRGVWASPGCRTHGAVDVLRCAEVVKQLEACAAANSRSLIFKHGDA